MSQHLPRRQFPARGNRLLDLILLDEVLAGAKGFFAGAREDGDAEGGFGVEPGGEGIGFPMGGVGEGVHGGGAVDSYEEDVGGGVGEEVSWGGRGLGGEGGGHGCE